MTHLRIMKSFDLVPNIEFFKFYLKKTYEHLRETLETFLGLILFYINNVKKHMLAVLNHLKQESHTQSDLRAK